MQNPCPSSPDSYPVDRQQEFQFDDWDDMESRLQQELYRAYEEAKKERECLERMLVGNAVDDALGKVMRRTGQWQPELMVRELKKDGIRLTWDGQYLWAGPSWRITSEWSETIKAHRDKLIPFARKVDERGGKGEATEEDWRRGSVGNEQGGPTSGQP